MSRYFSTIIKLFSGAIRSRSLVPRRLSNRYIVAGVSLLKTIGTEAAFDRSPRVSTGPFEERKIDCVGEVGLYDDVVAESRQCIVAERKSRIRVVKYSITRDTGVNDGSMIGEPSCQVVGPLLLRTIEPTHSVVGGYRWPGGRSGVTPPREVGCQRRAADVVPDAE